MIFAFEHVGAFQRPEIRDILHDAQNRWIAAWIAAKRAGRGGVEIAADFAIADRRGRVAHRRAERLEKAFAFFQQHQRRTPCRARAQTRQFCQQLNQTLDFGTGGKRRHQPPDPRPGGRPMSRATFCISSATSRSTLALAFAWAATIRSSTICRLSDFNSDGSIETFLNSDLPLRVTCTSPAPAMPAASIVPTWSCIAFILLCTSLACLSRLTRSITVPHLRLPAECLPPIAGRSRAQFQRREHDRAPTAPAAPAPRCRAWPGWSRGARPQSSARRPRARPSRPTECRSIPSVSARDRPRGRAARCPSDEIRSVPVPAG